MKIYKRKPQDNAPLAQADPYVVKGGDGKFYLYATQGQVYTSDSLMGEWRYEGIRLHMPGQKVCWAPSVIEIGGVYYMYYSSMDEGCTDEHGQAMRVAAADSPMGPFEYKKTLLDPFAIDAHVVQTPSGLYMFYCNNDYDAERAGTRIWCDRMTDPYTMEGRPACAVWPTMDEEIYMRDRFRPGQHWHTIEGAFYFYREGIHFLMYSGGCYLNGSYFVGYCTAQGPADADLRGLHWEKYPDDSTFSPLLKSNGFVDGPGHNSVVFDNGKCYIVYHGRDYEHQVQEGGAVPADAGEAEDTRCARIDEMQIDGKKLSVTMTP